MDNRDVSLARAFRESWAAFSKYAGLAIGGYLICFLIGGAAGGVGGVLAMFVTLPLTGGMTILFLKMAKNDSPTMDDLFAGFKDYWKWMGVGCILIAIRIACFLPLLFIAAGIAILVAVKAGANPNGNPLSFLSPLGWGIGIALVIASLVFAIAVLIRFSFAYYLAAEGCGIAESIERSSDMTKGIRLKLVGIGIAAAVVGALGVIVIGLGWIVTIPYTQCVMAAVYLAAKGGEQESPEAPSQPAEPQG